MRTARTTSLFEALAFTAPVLAGLLGGCNGALVGNLFVVAVTLGIFFGTLGLGRGNARRTSSERSAERSGAEQPRA